ncbi:uncharacterized protein BXZ73DRAFT_99158 [Epithele typhae]|uniref:uncharacterized protein n=1 Tax=Epithele typhae TaxID=378194 RepID=UPI002008793B|nr:uncharacterized protein BXZ73DRAFT_99158 [Epithele typhae]KAH9940160.1 hypothetical protein BXZ73DRAFT_99158 [Epithele typhae]
MSYERPFSSNLGRAATPAPSSRRVSRSSTPAKRISSSDLFTYADALASQPEVTFTSEQAFSILRELWVNGSLDSIPTVEGSSSGTLDSLLPPPAWAAANFPDTPKVAFYMWHGVFPETNGTLASGQKSYLSFVQLERRYLNGDGSWLPASEASMLGWLAELGFHGLTMKTIKGYILDLYDVHAARGLPFPSCTSPSARQLIRGMKVCHARSARPNTIRPKHPITLTTLQRICTRARARPDSLHSTVTTAAATLGFAAFLRLSELAVPDGTAFDPARHLTRGAVAFLPSRADPTHVALTIPASLDDPFRQEEPTRVLVAAAPGHPTCPVAALRRLFKLTPTQLDGPLFPGREIGTALSRSELTAALAQGLDAEENVRAWGSEGSLRKGARLQAMDAEWSAREVVALQWRGEDLRMLYEQAGEERALEMSAALHVAGREGRDSGN